MQALTLCSTGGMIALGLGLKNWSVETYTRRFTSLCKDAFTPRKGLSIPGYGFLVKAHHSSKFETRPFEDALKEAFSEDDYLFGGPRFGISSSTKVAITTTSTTAQVVVLSNYNRQESSENKCKQPDLMIWTVHQ